MHALLLLHFAVTWALAGLIWTIQVTHYPLFAQVGAEAFPAYHAAHTRTVTWVVAPLMLAELATGAWLLRSGCRDVWFLISLALLAVNWLSTALLQIPLHERLAAGFNTHTHALLVTTNWIRTAAWSLRGLLLVPLLLHRP